MTLSIVILAAGQGKRMHSRLPKVLHSLAGKSLLERAINTAYTLKPSTPPIVIFGHQGEQVREALQHLDTTWVKQEEQLGTGHAVLQTLPHIPQDNRVLILYGDVPLISTETLQQLLNTTPENQVGIITAHFNNPTGLGRIVRNEQSAILRIVEEKDATSTERTIQEINSGIYLVPAKYLQRWLPTLSNQNAQQEYYLTDIIQKAVAENISITSIQPTHPQEVYGINDRVQLAELETFHRQLAAETFMRSGVTLLDPKRFDLRGELIAGQDVTIDVNVIIEGKVSIGNNCHIGPNCVLRDTIIADNVIVKANSVIEGADIGENCVIGPFARIRPETELSSNVHVGNFVEIKKSWIGTGSKVNHLTYIGDSEIGKQVNVGAGTITCNYDGVNKNKTIIGDNAFIGSNTSLVAPIKIGEGATIGAGSTISREAPANQLTLCRADQRSLAGWQRPKKNPSANKTKES